MTSNKNPANCKRVKHRVLTYLRRERDFNRRQRRGEKKLSEPFLAFVSFVSFCWLYISDSGKILWCVPFAREAHHRRRDISGELERRSCGFTMKSNLKGLVGARRNVTVFELGFGRKARSP
jgi:hypothetical protein